MTSNAYDPNGNVVERVDPKLRADNTDERRINRFSYDAADRLTQHVDLGGPSCGDEQRIDTDYLSNDWVGREKVAKSTAACEPEASWPLRQQSGYEYFGNGLVKKQTTWQGDQDPQNVVESHTLEYESGGIYLNGHQTVDSFSLKGPDTAAECRSYDESVARPCKYRYGYDARERLTNWTLQRRDTGTGPGETLSAISYTLDQDTPATNPTGATNPADPLVGDVIREVTTGLWATPSVTRTFAYYPSGRLKTVTETGSPTDHYSHWQRDGYTISCVTADEQPQTDIPTTTCEDGSTQSGLRDWSKFDPLDRLKTFKSYRADATRDSSYTHDAFDRVSSQTENPNASGPVSTKFEYLGLTGEVVTETHSGARAGMKSYTYDAFGRRVGMTASEGGATRNFTFARNIHGDISLLLNDAGTATAAYGYTPYGALDTNSRNASAGLSRGDTSTTNPTNAYRFNDRRFDSGSGSIDMGARRFGPNIARFLQQDFYRNALDDLNLSIDPVTQNRFSFAGGNPISFVETDGHHHTLRFREMGRRNYWRGTRYEGRVLNELHLIGIRRTPENRLDLADEVDGPIPEGTQRRFFYDAQPYGAFFEIKSSRRAGFSPQQRAQVAYARAVGNPYYMIVGRRTKVSRRFAREVREQTGGAVIRREGPGRYYTVPYSFRVGRGANSRVVRMPRVRVRFNHRTGQWVPHGKGRLVPDEFCQRPPCP